nr:immunoglobulin light chain junction region [Macaca mulatta]MOW52549.1 immunoglobulin light chain junction region [Macaca mulatta]MOW53003.1 immunoglobulin light chain junction region [Macaca mulatta]MOW54551.1 immunoglobulin light chain junction region [Macaca mulatta]MOW56198.1 immunoglobulin light chain junction region [Macaca mulatta]
CLQYNRSPFTF